MSEPKPGAPHLKELIQMGFGPVNKDTVHFKIIHTVLLYLAQQMRLLDQQVEVHLDTFDAQELSKPRKSLIDGRGTSSRKQTTTRVSRVPSGSGSRTTTLETNELKVSGSTKVESRTRQTQQEKKGSVSGSIEVKARKSDTHKLTEKDQARTKADGRNSETLMKTREDEEDSRVTELQETLFKERQSKEFVKGAIDEEGLIETPIKIEDLEKDVHILDEKLSGEDLRKEGFGREDGKEEQYFVKKKVEDVERLIVVEEESSVGKGQTESSLQEKEEIVGEEFQYSQEKNEATGKLSDQRLPIPVKQSIVAVVKEEQEGVDKEEQRAETHSLDDKILVVEEENQENVEKGEIAEAEKDKEEERKQEQAEKDKEEERKQEQDAIRKEEAENEKEEEVEKIIEDEEKDEERTPESCSMPSRITVTEEERDVGSVLVVSQEPLKEETGGINLVSTERLSQLDAVVDFIEKRMSVARSPSLLEDEGIRGVISRNFSISKMIEVTEISDRLRKLEKGISDLTNTLMNLTKEEKEKLKRNKEASTKEEKDGKANVSKAYSESKEKPQSFKKRIVETEDETRPGYSFGFGATPTTVTKEVSITAVDETVPADVVEKDNLMSTEVGRNDRLATTTLPQEITKIDLALDDLSTDERIATINVTLKDSEMNETLKAPKDSFNLRAPGSNDAIIDNEMDKEIADSAEKRYSRVGIFIPRSDDNSEEEFKVGERYWKKITLHNNQMKLEKARPNIMSPKLIQDQVAIKVDAASEEKLTAKDRRSPIAGEGLDVTKAFESDTSPYGMEAKANSKARKFARAQSNVTDKVKFRITSDIGKIKGDLKNSVIDKITDELSEAPRVHKDAEIPDALEVIKSDEGIKLKEFIEGPISFEEPGGPVVSKTKIISRTDLETDLKEQLDSTETLKDLHKVEALKARRSAISISDSDINKKSEIGEMSWLKVSSSKQQIKLERIHIKHENNEAPHDSLLTQLDNIQISSVVPVSDEDIYQKPEENKEKSSRELSETSWLKVPKRRRVLKLEDFSKTDLELKTEESSEFFSDKRSAVSFGALRSTANLTNLEAIEKILRSDALDTETDSEVGASKTPTEKEPENNLGEATKKERPSLEQYDDDSVSASPSMKSFKIFDGSAVEKSWLRMPGLSKSLAKLMGLASASDIAMDPRALGKARTFKFKSKVVSAKEAKRTEEVAGATKVDGIGAPTDTMVEADIVAAKPELTEELSATSLVSKASHLSRQFKDNASRYKDGKSLEDIRSETSISFGKRLTVLQFPGVTMDELNSALLNVKDELTAHLDPNLKKLYNTTRVAKTVAQQNVTLMESFESLSTQILTIKSSLKRTTQRVNEFKLHYERKRDKLDGKFEGAREELENALNLMAQPKNIIAEFVLFHQMALEKHLLQYERLMYKHGNESNSCKHIDERMKALHHCNDLLSKERVDCAEVEKLLQNKASICMLFVYIPTNRLRSKSKEIKSHIDAYVDLFLNNHQKWMDMLKKTVNKIRKNIPLFTLTKFKEKMQKNLQVMHHRISRLTKEMGNPQILKAEIERNAKALCGICMHPAIMLGRSHVDRKLPESKKTENDKPVKLFETLKPPYCRRWTGGSHTVIRMPPKNLEKLPKYMQASTSNSISCVPCAECVPVAYVHSSADMMNTTQKSPTILKDGLCYCHSKQKSTPPNPQNDGEKPTDQICQCVTKVTQQNEYLCQCAIKQNLQTDQICQCANGEIVQNDLLCHCNKEKVCQCEEKFNNRILYHCEHREKQHVDLVCQCASGDILQTNRLCYCAYAEKVCDCAKEDTLLTGDLCQCIKGEKLQTDSLCHCGKIPCINLCQCTSGDDLPTDSHETVEK